MTPGRLPSLLELLLPGGRASAAVVLGTACPSRLRPASEAPATRSGQVDLAVVAPGARELEEDGWLERAVARAAGALSADGVIYLLVPPRSRGRARRLLRRRGLAIEQALLHLPDVRESRHVVPLQPRAAGHAFRHTVPLVPWKRAAVTALLHARAGRLLERIAPGVGLVARVPGAAPSFDWLRSLDGAPSGRRAVVLTSSWRPRGPRVVLEPFPPGKVVTKLALDGEATTEGERLTRLGAAARISGARAPEVVATGELHGAAALVETRVGGMTAMPILARRPARLEPILEEVVHWLADWQRLTATPGRLDAALLESELLAPAETIAPELDDGRRFLDRVAERCARVEGSPVALAAAHNDLTMANVLVGGGVGVVDWEAAQEATLPLKDFFYASADAVAATERYRDRPGAARACFGSDGRHAAWIRQLQSVVADASGADIELSELSFQATWIGHAANELRTAGASAPHPFLDIARWLAQ